LRFLPFSCRLGCFCHTGRVVSLSMDLGKWRQELSELEVDVLSADQCAALVVDLSKLIKAGEAKRAQLAARAEAGYAHRQLGYTNAADWLAEAAGTSTGEARKAIETAIDAAQCPATEQAWRNGELSTVQAAEITETEKAQPGNEDELLATARSKPLRALKDKARHQRLKGCDPNDLRKRQRQARLLRHWTDELGLGCVAVRMLPEQATAVMARLDHRTEQLRRQARREGKDEAWDARAAAPVEVADSAIAPRDEGGRQV